MQKKRTTSAFSIILTFFLVFLFSSLSIAQESIMLLSVDGEKSPQNRHLAEHRTSFYNVQINKNAFGALNRGDRFTIDLPHKGHGDFKVIRVAEFIPGVISISAHEVGTKENIVTLNMDKDGKILGQMELFADHKFYELRTDPVSKSQFMAAFNSSQRDELTCGLSTHADEFLEPIKSHNHMIPGKETSILGDSSTKNLPGIGHELDTISRHTAGPDGKTTLDILLVYTSNADNWAAGQGGIDLVIAEMINRSQNALDNSEIAVELRVVFSGLINYNQDGDSGVSGVDQLRRITTSPEFSLGTEFEGYMNEVHDLRNQYGADLVSGLMLLSDIGGVAWRGSSAAPDPRYAFSINRIQQMTTTYTFIHEVGHNLGLAHSRNQQSNTANIFGGGFEYSTGWRFTTSQAQTFATVMTYPEGDERIPVFSNPDILWQGEPTGSYDGFFAPADAARAIRHTAPFIAGNRATTLMPPIPAVDQSPISVTLGLDTIEEMNITVANNGESILYARPEFRASSTSAQSIVLPQSWKENALMNAQAEDNRIWGSDFSQGSNFQTGSFQIINDWRIFAQTLQDSYQIVEDPSEVNGQMLQFGYQNNSQNNSFLSVRSAYDGLFSTGGYYFSSTFKISGSNPPNYYFELYDPSVYGKNESFSWLNFSPNGFIFFVSGLTANNQWIQQNSGVEWVADEFKTVEVIYHPAENEVKFYYDGEFLGSAPPLSAVQPAQGRVWRVNTGVGSVAEYRHITLNRMYDGLGFVRSSTPALALDVAQADFINLTFDTNGLEPGFYEADLVVYTNAIDSEKIVIPIELEVTGQVSVESPEIPLKASLEQNYPNPFNPTTMINFQLPESGNVTLEVYNMAGQRVQTLVNGLISQGNHSVNFDASELSSGMYIYRLSSEFGTISRKMLLVK